MGANYEKLQFFKLQGINLMESSSSGNQIPLVSREAVEDWASKYDIIRGVSPRWLVPVVVGRTDSLILVADVMKEL